MLIGPIMLLAVVPALQLMFARPDATPEDDDLDPDEAPGPAASPAELDPGSG
jgi:hypothetical protein